METSAEPRYSQKLSLRNTTPSPISIQLEPWGDAYALPPGEVYDIVATAPTQGSLELEFESERLAVYGWAGSIVNIYCDGKELGERLGPRQPFPELPPGKTTREFLNTVLGRKPPKRPE